MMTGDDVIRRTYRIVQWGRWDDEVDAAARDFGARYGLWPNVMLAREATYTRLETMARRDRIQGEHGEAPPSGELVELSRFAARDYELELCVDDLLSLDTFELVFDPSPEFEDGEEPDGIEWHVPPEALRAPAPADGVAAQLALPLF